MQARCWSLCFLIHIIQIWIKKHSKQNTYFFPLRKINIIETIMRSNPISLREEYQSPVSFVRGHKIWHLEFQQDLISFPSNVLSIPRCHTTSNYTIKCSLLWKINAKITCVANDSFFSEICAVLAPTLLLSECNILFWAPTQLTYINIKLPSTHQVYKTKGECIH